MVHELPLEELDALIDDLNALYTKYSAVPNVKDDKRGVSMCHKVMQMKLYVKNRERGGWGEIDGGLTPFFCACP